MNAQGAIDYQAALNVDKNEVQSKSSSNWMGLDMSWVGFIANGKKETNDSSIQTRAATTSLQSQADILSQSGGDTRLQGTQVKAGSFTVNAGVGAGADPNAKIVIEGVKETLQTSHTEKSESLVWQAQSGNGSTSQTLALANIQAKTKFSAPGGIDVQLPAGDPLKEQVQSLSQQPGMTWLNELSQRKDVNWQQIKLAKDSWSYDQQGLTPAGAAILAIAVAVMTAGAAGSAAASIATEAGMTTAAGTAGASTAAAAGAGVAGSGVAAGTVLTTTGAAFSSAMAAGMTTLASSAAVSLANNQGDLGKTLKDMGSSQNIKGVLTAMVTAGVLTELGSATTATGQTGANAQAISTAQEANKFTANLMRNVTNNMASAVVSSAINGKPLNEETLSTALTSALVTSGMAQVANSIGAAATGTNPTLNVYTQAMAHALAGCVGGAATTGGGCSAGAVGAVVGELSATYALNQNMSDTATVNFAKTMSAVAGALVGGPNSAASVNVAAQMGANAALNNALTGKQQRAKELLKQQAATPQDAATIDAAFKELDDRQTKALVSATNAKDAYTLANTSQEKQQAYEKLKSAYADLGDIASALTKQGDGAGASLYSKAVLTTYLTLQVAAKDLDQPATPLTPVQRDMVAKQFMELGIALDASDSASARTTLQKLNSTSSTAATNAQTSNGGVAAGELTLGERTVANALENGPSTTAPVGRGGSPMSVAPGTNTPAAIDGVNYSGHALDQMQGRGVVPSAVKSTIENGTIFPTGLGTTGYYDAATNLRAIVNSTNGRVVTVIPGKP